MSYNGKTDWKLDEMVYPEDMNRIEGQIEKNTSEIEGVSGKIGNPSDGEEQLTLFGKLAAILAKVLGIDTKVGTSDDAKTKPTLFGKIAGIGDTLSENLTPVTEKITEVLNKVTGIDGKIGTSGDTAGSATLFGQVKDISEKMPTGTIKSIQRGMFRWSSGMNTQGAEIVISTVNPEKCIVMLSCSSDNEYGSGSIGEAAVKKLEPEKLSLYVAGRANLLFVWQVIECF